MYQIESNKEKNRIYLKLSGFMHDEEVHEAAERFKGEVIKLSPGIDVINDISEFRPASLKGAGYIKDAQTFLVQYGMKRVVRIVHERVSGLLQFNTTGHSAGLEATQVSSLSEAEKILDQP